jgi:hypothetical protein
MAAPKGSSAVIVVRSNKTVALPPSLLGFNEFTEPDTYDPQKPKFKGNFHFTPQALQDLPAIIQTSCVDGLLEKLTEEFAEKQPKLTLKACQDVGEWLEAKIKAAKEDAQTDWQALPFLQVSMPATRKTKDGTIETREVACWDAKNAKLPLAKLRLGRGSVVQAVIRPSLYWSKLIGFPQPTVQLVGVRILKLVRWGGAGAAAPERDDEEIRNVLGADFEADDLSEFLSMDEDLSPTPPDEDAGDTVGKMF